MLPIRPLHSFEQLKLLADPRRLAILRHLMAAPASLTQLGQALGEHPAWVRHHLKQLEAAGLIELVETRVASGVVEKFYRARAGGFLLQELILPQSGRPAVVFAGSHDLAMELLAEQLAPHLDLLLMPVGSLDGLVTLRQNLCQLSGCHLLDTSGEYNLPFVRHLFPDRAMQILTLGHRLQGLMLAPGNPKGIRGLADLTRHDVTFANRNPGSGTRLWLDQQLHDLGIPGTAVRGYDGGYHTHTECASLVAGGQADAALGLLSAAHQHGLDFLPLFNERYDLAFPQDQAGFLTPLFDRLQTSAFRQSAEALTGYEMTHTGESIPL